jgi:RND superfamily putative drug exporter
MFRRAVARPKQVLAAWAVVAGLLALLGASVDGRLHREDLEVPGTASAKANDLARKQFGDSQSLVVMLEGPRAALDSTTRRFAERVDRVPHVDTVGPWAPGAARELRPKPTRTIVLVRIQQKFEDASHDGVPRVRRVLAKSVHAPVRGYLTGYADVGHGIDREAIAAMKRAELIAVPLLLVVLLLVFRSPVAAALPLLLGQATILAGRGVIDLVNRVHHLDLVALNMASMMGLALGVDYSLVLVSRFREELAIGAPTREAVMRAARTAGHTILFAGLALACAMIAANFVAPGDILFSSGIGVLTSVVLSVAGAAVALPAALTLLGPRVNKWTFGGARTSGGWSGLVLRAIGRPALAAGLVMLMLGLLAAPALGLSLGPPDPRALPKSAIERRDFDEVAATLGGGWSAPYDIVVAARHGRITDPGRLEALADWQRSLAREDHVRGVFGVAPIARRMERLQSVAHSLKDAGRQLERAKRDQARLANGLTRVDGGVERMQEGLSDAASGAEALASGADRGGEGAERLRSGLAMAADGAERLQAGLDSAAAGASSLDDGAGSLARGSAQLERGLQRALRITGASLPKVDELRRGLAQGAADLSALHTPAENATNAAIAVRQALQRMTVGVADPQYRTALEAALRAEGNLTGRNPLTNQPQGPRYPGMAPAIGQASAGVGRAADGVARLQRGSQGLVVGLRRLASGARRLRSGVADLQDGARRLLRGIRRLKGGGGDLAGGLDRLRAGGDALAAGAERLAGGADRLAGGLGSGSQRVGRLTSGVDRMRAGVAESRERTAELGRGFGSGGVQTGLFRSGFLPLAALDSAPHAARVGASFAVNVDRGGDAAHVVVMRSGDPTDPGDPLRKRLEREAAGFGRAHDAQALVGGPAALLQDFQTEAAGRLWLLILALAGTTYLVLVPVLRSLLLPLLAVVLNIATVFAAFGVMTLCFQGTAPLGGPGNIDAIMVLAIFGIVFGLSIDYEVFLLARMREGYVLTGTTEGAIEYGLGHTAAVITGAALIMTGVFAAFALSDIASMRQLGVGLTVAVLLDATIVRLMLLPAIIRLAGGACWWLPGGLAALLAEERGHEGPRQAQPRGVTPFPAFEAFARNGTAERQRESARTR